MRRLHRHAAVVIAIALAGSLAACGDDDDESTSADTTPTTEVSGSDAVDVVMTENAFAVSGALNSGGTIRLRNDGREFHMMALSKLKEGKTLEDFTAILLAPRPEEETTTTAAGGADGSTTTSGAQASTTTAGGQTTTSAQAAPAGDEDPMADVVDDVGAPGAFQGPGQKAEITVPDMAAGSYAMVCFIPTEGGGPPHFVQGMIGELTVVGEKAAEPTADATFSVAPGQPVTGPSTLTAGKHVLKFEAAAGSEQLEPGLVLLDAGKTLADLNRAFGSFETATDFVLPVNATAQVPGKVIASLFDLGPAREVYLGVDLVPGTYSIAANDTDPDDALEDPVEKLTLTVS